MTLEDRLIATSGKGPGFDQIRLAAATIVLLHHCRLTQYDIHDPLYVYSGGFVHFGLLAVIIFFAISGFLVTPGLMRSGNIVQFTVNRALRIFPALLVVVVASMFCLGPALTSLYSDYFSDRLLYRYVKNALTLTQNYLPGVTRESGEPLVVNGALWTLHFEVLAYAALALACVLGLLRRRGYLLLALLASYAIYVLMSFSPSFTQYLPGRFATFMTLFVYFAAGCALFVFRDRIPFSGPLLLAALALLLLALPIGLGPALMPLCLPYITIVLGLSALPGQLLVKRDVSYGVYLIHAPIVTAFIVLSPSEKNWWLLAAMVTVVTAALAYISRILIEEPALNRKKALSNWITCRMAGVRSYSLGRNGPG